MVDPIRALEEPGVGPKSDEHTHTGLGRRAVVDLIRAGALDEVPRARGTCQITLASREPLLVTTVHIAVDRRRSSDQENAGWT